MRRVLLIALACAAVAPAAEAATVRVGATGAVDYAAAPGEANVLQVAASGSAVTVRDDGAPITGGGGCTATSAHAATCTVGGLPRVSAQLGDGDDMATATVASVVLDGGAGDDTLTGDEAPDVLVGGAGDDVLAGRGGDDALFGDGPGLTRGGGAVRVTGGAGADAIDCGAGSDRSDADPGDVIDGCEAPIVTAAPPEPTGASAPAPPVAPVDAGTIVPLQQVADQTARSKPVVPIALTVRSAASITRTTLLRRGLRVTVACSMVCRPTLALRRGTHTLVRRTVTAGLRAATVRLRARTAAGTVTLRTTVPYAATRTKRVRVR